MTNATATGLRQEFQARLQKLEKEGLVDFKAELDVGNHSSVHDMVRVYNNVLRQREEGLRTEIRLG